MFGNYKKNKLICDLEFEYESLKLYQESIENLTDEIKINDYDSTLLVEYARIEYLKDVSLNNINNLLNQLYKMEVCK